MSVICFYHRSDLDGKCSAAIVHRYYKKHMKVLENVELIGLNHGDDYEKLVFDQVRADDTVIMVDFSLQPFSLMVRLADLCDRARDGRFAWIDHHIEAINEYMKLQDLRRIAGVRLDGIAACELTWKYFFPNAPLPEAVRLLAKFDVWQWKDEPNALAFQMGMRMMNNNPVSSIWEPLLAPHDPRCEFEETQLGQIVRDGQVIVQYQVVQNKIHMSASFDLDWHGMKWLAINEMFCNSQLFDSKWDPKKYHGMLAFGWRNKKWSVSLYTTRDDVDVGRLATEIGKILGGTGGGHKKAAGFTCQVLPFRPVEPM
jgi:DHHA1 domain